MTHIIT